METHELQRRPDAPRDPEPVSPELSRVAVQREAIADERERLADDRERDQTNEPPG